jgi:predicted unusual protein kinase regulating ubiquinone biosynthesis (AarF/ABC1/UbiB family)
VIALRIVWRAFQILLVLFGMFWAWVYSQTGVRKLVWRTVLRSRPFEPLENPRILRHAFESLGPSFIKLGQVIASSPGLFPKRYSDEFQRCLDRVKPFPVPALMATVARELGRPVAALFATFDAVPLGSASIAQVHAATLPDGREVVVKVQRPGIRVKVDADVWWMRRLAWVAEKLFTGARLANVRGVIEDFDRTIHEEIDFRMEGKNLSEFNRLMAKYGIPDVKAPTPIEGHVTASVLVMERFHGLKADDRDGIIKAGMNPEVYLRKGLRAWLMTMALDGYFHGDAHAGNLMMLPEGSRAADGTPQPAVGLLDFGIIGRFTTQQRHQVLRYVLAFTAQDYEALAEVMTEIGAVKTNIDRTLLVSELARVYSPLIEKNLADIKYEEILPDITAVAYRFGIRLPSEFLLILKQLLFFDRYAKLMAPNLNVFSDWHLVDFLFGPLAATSGLDFNVLFPLLMRVQKKFAEKGVVMFPAPRAAS